MEWPDIGKEPINEFRTPSLATQAFPAFFPCDKGDRTNPGHQCDVSLTDGLKHLMKFGEIQSSSDLHWTFANHPLLGTKHQNYNTNLCHRSTYLNHNPGDANLLVEELSTMVNTPDSENLMTRICC